MTIGGESLLRLDRILVMSVDLLNVARIGLGEDESSLYFPSLRQSLTENSCKLESMEVVIDEIDSKS